MRALSTLTARLVFSAIVFLTAWVVSGCGQSAQTNSASGVARIDFDKGNERELLRFYVGGMISRSGTDPFSEGIVTESANSYILDVSALAQKLPYLKEELLDINSDGTINWTEFESLVQRYYYRYRFLPDSLDILIREEGDWHRSDWFSLDVNGVMSPRRRRIHVRKKDLMSALSGYSRNNRAIIYPEGTVFISEHVSEGVLKEISAMRKRKDGFWDFFAYSSDSLLTDRIEQRPKDLMVPTKCVGCHFGSRLFEPEKSFPQSVRDAPDGPRRIYSLSNERTRRVVLLLDEHRRRSDRVLGLYGTLFLSALMQRDGFQELSRSDSSIFRFFEAQLETEASEM
jgi:hypothetical protein